MNTAEAAAIANASRALLAQGDAVGAERLLTPVFGALKSDASVLHLMGIIKRTLNQLDEAERYLRSAVAYSLSEGGYYNDLGVVLQARGAFAEALRVYRAALALTPQAAAVRVNIVRCLLESGNIAAAEEEARAFVAIAPGAESWTLLGQVQRTQERHDDALASASAALKFQPRLRALQLNYAGALERVGRTKEALEGYEKLARQDLDSVELALNLARALYLEGRKQDAEAVLEQGVKLFPASTQLHSTLARARWLRGEGEKATALAEAESARRPNDLALRLAVADALHRGQHHQRALQVLADALQAAPESASILTAFGVILDELDRPLDGLKALRHAAELTPGAAGQRNLLSTLIRAGQPEEALRIAHALRADDPDEQYLIACEALALRVLGDPAYAQLCDYERDVRSYELSAPRGYFTLQNFNAALADVLRRLHRTLAHPLDQHLQHGSQTHRRLLALKEPALTAFMTAADDAVRDYISRLPENDSEHPLARRRRQRYRYVDLSSVRLMHEGYQPNHVRDRGWLSAVYVVALTPNEAPRDPRAGWLKLGEPNRPVAGCAPEKWIEPKEGRLVLFPSYMWQGSVPFEGGERLTLAFDIIPV